VVVNNAVGSVTSSGAVLTVTPVNVAPAITAQPQNQNVNQGGNATFTVVASGTPAPSYQWRFNNTPISGATDSSYTVVNAQPGDAGGYSVEVSNLAGSVMSDVATLTVIEPVAPRIDWISVTPGGPVRLLVSGSPGHYAIEASSNLVNWVELTNFTTTSNQFQYLQPSASEPQRFYRVLLIP